MLIEKEEIINENAKVGNLFNFYFESANESFDLFRFHITLVLLLKQKQNLKVSTNFSFTSVEVKTVKNNIPGLPENKSVSGGIPLNVLNSGFTF